MRNRISFASTSFLIVTAVTILMTESFAQTPFKIPMTIVDTVFNTAGGTINRIRTSTIYWGLDPTAGDCMDFPAFHSGFATRWSIDDADSVQENDYPGDPPNGERFVFQLVASCQNAFVFMYNIQQFRSTTQADTFRVSYGLDYDAAFKHSPTVFKWPKVLGEYFDSCIIVSAPGQPILANLRTDSQMVLPVPADLTTAYRFTVYYKGIRAFPGAPPTPTPIAPLDGATGVPQPVTVEWTTPAAGADYYILQVSTDSTFASHIVYSGPVGTNSVALSPSLSAGTKYFWRATTINKYGASIDPTPPYRFTPSAVLGVEPSGVMPGEFGLSQNYPNPFNPATVIRYQLPARSFVSLTVFDELGRKMATLVNEIQEPGFKSVQFDGGRFASGLYTYELKAGTYSERRKMLLVK